MRKNNIARRFKIGIFISEYNYSLQEKAILAYMDFIFSIIDEKKSQFNINRTDYTFDEKTYFWYDERIKTLYCGELFKILKGLQIEDEEIIEILKVLIPHYFKKHKFNSIVDIIISGYTDSKDNDSFLIKS
jgi:hypothetical protein